MCTPGIFITIITVLNKEATTIHSSILVDVLMNEIGTYQGTEFKNELLRELSKLLHIEHKTSTATVGDSIGDLRDIISFSKSTSESL